MCLQRNCNTEVVASKGEHLTEAERYKIEGLKQAKLSNRAIAKILGKSHSFKRKNFSVMNIG